MAYRKMRKTRKPKRLAIRRVYPFGSLSRAFARRVAFKRSSKGGIVLLRKLPELAVSSSSSIGVATLTQNLNAGAPVCLTLGTPVQSTGGSGTSYDVPFSLQFALSQIINHTDLTNLCDKYKIAGAYIRFYYNHTGSSGNSAAPFPHLQYITDHDDSNVPTRDQLREKMGVKFKTFRNSSSYIGMKCRPVPNRQIFSSALVNGYEVPKNAPFLDCATDAIPHYGIKGIISNFNLPATAGLEVMKVDVALKLVGKDIQ